MITANELKIKELEFKSKEREKCLAWGREQLAELEPGMIKMAERGHNIYSMTYKGVDNQYLNALVEVIEKETGCAATRANKTVYISWN
jgi:hypothetical protein